MYPFFEKAVKHGKTAFACHKGLMPADYETSWADKWQYNTVWDVAKAAKDWPEINFIIYHSGMRPFLEDPTDVLAEFEATGELKWASDLARIPEEHGVINVYAELGTTFANSCVTHPRLAAGMLGTLIKGMGADKIVWGTDSVFYGSPQWQIEAMRRIEIPEDMQEKHGLYWNKQIAHMSRQTKVFHLGKYWNALNIESFIMNLQHFDQPPLRDLVIRPPTALQLLKRRITIPCELRLVANQMTNSQMHTLFVPVH